MTLSRIHANLANVVCMPFMKASFFSHVDDIDVFAGGVSERAVRGGLIGPTFGCIIAEAFKNLRQGDRFWYENDGMFTGGKHWWCSGNSQFVN